MSRIVDYQQSANGGFNPYDYSNFHKAGTINSNATANTFSTLLSITGKGVLTKALIGTDNAHLRRLRITIDGTVVFYGTSSTAGSYYTGSVGILQSADLLQITQNSANLAGAIINNALFSVSNNAQYPLATEQVASIANGSNAILSNGIRFNSSLLIEIMSNSPSETINFDYNYLL